MALGANFAMNGRKQGIRHSDTIMPIPEDSKLQKIKKQIETWNNRAAMARQMGNGDLEQQALDRKKESENALAQLQEFELE